MFKNNNNNLVYVIIIFVIIFVVYIFLSMKKENFIINYKNTLTTPSKDEQILIDEIVNDIENCFINPSDLNVSSNICKKITIDFRSKWMTNILDAIKNKLYYNEILQARNSSLNFEETLMSKYYKNVIKTLTDNYCNKSNSNYLNFQKLYKTELTKIVDHIECLIKKIECIKKGTPASKISINREELFYQIECIQQYIYKGLRNQFADPIGFYEKLYDLIMNAANDDYNFCANTSSDYGININDPIMSPSLRNCPDLTSTFITPFPTINPTGCVINNSDGSPCTKTPSSHVETIAPMVIKYKQSSNNLLEPTTVTPNTFTQKSIYPSYQYNPYDILESDTDPFNQYNNSSFPQLLTGSSQSSTGSSQLLTGSSQSSTGSSQPSTGSSQLSTGSSQPSTGSSQQLIGLSRQLTGSLQPSISSSQQLIGLSRQFSGSSEQKQNDILEKNMTQSYKIMPDFIQGNKKYNSNQHNQNTGDEYNVIPINSDEYDVFTEYDLIQPKINLISAKGPNNFFIPNIWIEEYK